MIHDPSQEQKQLMVAEVDILAGKVKELRERLTNY
jgi:hypothetical protein